MKKILSVLLAAALCVGITVPALALNLDGVEFTATLSTNTLTASDNDQTVTLTVGTTTALTFDGVGYYISATDKDSNDVAFTYTAITSTIGSGDNAISFSSAKTGTRNGKFVVGYYTADAENTTDTFLGSFTVTIPGETPAGTYYINVTKIESTKDYGDPNVTDESASATLTIVEAATDGYTVTMSADSSVQSGEKANVSLNVTHDSNTEFNAFQAELSYDTGVFSYDANSSETGDFTISESTSGTLEISRTGDSIRIPGTGAELELVFKALETTVATAGTFSLTNVKVSSASEVRGGDANAATVINANQTVNVTVEETITLLEIAVTTPPDKTKYDVGDAFDTTGMVVTAYYDDGNENTVTDYTVTPATLTADTTSVTISYTEGDVTTETTVAITMNASTAPTVTVNKTSTTYLSSESYKLIEVTATNLPAGSVPTYNGELMFQVKNAADGTFYDESAYYYIVATGDYDDSLVSYDTGTATVIDHAGTCAADSNGTEVIDINDAQFINNIYSDYYSELTAAELLRADVNGDGAVNVSDCAAVVAAIFS